MRTRTTRAIAIPVFLLLLSSGCMKIALRLSPSVLENFSASVFEECDPVLAEQAIPANLKLLEGLLKNDPGNQKILTLLSMGYAGYSMLFMEDEAPARASRFYRRALNFGMRALGESGRILISVDSNDRDIKRALSGIGPRKFEALFWSTASWNAWISLNLDKPVALAQSGPSRACLERLIALNPHYFYGFPYLLMGVSLAAVPQMLGGNSKKAKEYFERAIFEGKGKFFLAHYYYARYYATRVQDRDLFSNLVGRILQGDPYALKDVCLINTVIQEKAMGLQEMADELFF
ncbi:MAG: hypothetical protein JRJ29_20400 [Deltaproteobacteria bacterium]|nr:hypothetical protein [Deltaproteobacteria bacterium]